ncbi:uncharacterized protein LOC110699982 [Chenopodium quinoa]|uniref:uncharacterized protein LOC110699982 n=1 Tax=Chenopodium quinoa TaxID=63459 RepID=UPI000B77D5CE|nr:uncharacterized protein LOC110699982 [Chenopodium quinoa]
MADSMEHEANKPPEAPESDEDIPLNCDSDDESCLKILLNKEENKRLRAPWKFAIIVKLFDKRMSYEVLIKRLRLKWHLKGDIALTDVGNAYYVVHFNNMEDYDWVLTQGPWMIKDSYLKIRKWEPNFLADEAPIKKLNTWVRIPQLSVEYIDKQFLLKIRLKIGRVIKIDRNTESMDRGQYIRFCIEVDLSKPLLSKFRLNGYVGKIQYEGLRQICFKCGHLGHKEDGCNLFKLGGDLREVIVREQADDGAAKESHVHKARPEEKVRYGSWMLV